MTFGAVRSMQCLSEFLRINEPAYAFVTGDSQSLKSPRSDSTNQIIDADYVLPDVVVCTVAKSTSVDDLDPTYGVFRISADTSFLD